MLPAAFASVCESEGLPVCVWCHLHAGHDDPLLSSEILINSKTCKCVHTDTHTHIPVFTQAITFYSLHSAPSISFFLYLSFSMMTLHLCLQTYAITFSLPSFHLLPFQFFSYFLSCLSFTCLFGVNTKCRLPFGHLIVAL